MSFLVRKRSLFFFAENVDRLEFVRVARNESSAAVDLGMLAHSMRFGKGLGIVNDLLLSFALSKLISIIVYARNAALFWTVVGQDRWQLR